MPYENKMPSWLKLGVLSLVALALLLALLMGCERRPKPEPPPVDTVGDTITDTSVVLAEGDTVEWPGALEEPGELEPSDTLLPPGPRPRAMPVNQGLPVGPSQYKAKEWCGGYLPATRVAGHPDLLAGILRKADYCNMRISFTVPRRYMTTNGENRGPYSRARSEQILTRVGNALRPLPTNLQDNLIDVSVLDDMGCKECWNGGISQAITAGHTRFARNAFPSWVAVGLRVEPTWMAGAGITDWGVNVTTSQWTGKKGPRQITDLAKKQMAWMELQRTAAAKVGVQRQLYAVNLGHFMAGDTPPATAAQMRLHLGQALNFDPEHNCGSISWMDYPHLRQRSDYARAWRELIEIARSKTPLSCGGA